MPHRCQTQRQCTAPTTGRLRGKLQSLIPVEHAAKQSRIMSAGLIPLTVAPFATGSLNPTLDSLLIAGILIHSHIGFESVIIDYVPEHRMPRLRKLLMWALKAATVVVGIGFYEFETNDVGLTEAIKRVWKA